jgi:DNA-binding FadR family transcriptional regulator
LKNNGQKQVITEKLIAFIKDNELEVGDKLPPERKLAEMLSSSRNTVREALRELAIKGQVKTKSGSGCFVTSLEDSADWGSLRGNADSDILKEHMEALVAIEPLIVSQAVEKSSPEDIKGLKQVMVRLSNAIINDDTTGTGDGIIEFTRLISKISRNRFYILIIREMNLERQILSEILSNCNKETIQDIFKTHVEIVNCFQHKDAGMAAKLALAGRELRHRLFLENVR